MDYTDRSREHYTKPEYPSRPDDIVALGWEYRGSVPAGDKIRWMFRKGHFYVEGIDTTDERALNRVRWQLVWREPEPPFYMHTNMKGDLDMCSECGQNPTPVYGGWCPDCACGAESGCPAKYGERGEPCPHEWCPNGGTSPDYGWTAEER